MALTTVSPSFSEPSQFWQQLAGEHRADLERLGPTVFKRRQALRYFNWRWSWRRVWKSRQLLFLLTHSRPHTVFRCLLSPAKVSSEEWHGVRWSRPERWLYVFAVRLLWEYARRRDELGTLSLPEPTLGGPIPVRWRGRLVSQDLANSALEVRAIARALDGKPPSSIVEVGAGYGRTAYALLARYPDAEYTIVDIEPALTISRWYLTSLFPSAHLRFLDPEAATLLPDGSVDLVVSISSLQEMRPDQVSRYLTLFDRIARGGVVYLKQWERWTNPVDGVTLAFDAYPIPASWNAGFVERVPVQTNFRHAAWRVPTS